MNAEKLHVEDQPDDVRWFGSKEKMAAQFRSMLQNGWFLTEQGIVSVNEKGETVVARPVRFPGEDATGIGTWTIN